MYITIILVSFNQQMSVLKENITNFSCENLYKEDSPIYYMAKDHDVECWSTGHLLWSLLFALPLLLLWGVILPAILFHKLRKQKHNLTKEAIKKKYSFFYVGYKREYYYWEFMVFFRKIALLLMVIICGLHSRKL